MLVDFCPHPGRDPAPCASDGTSVTGVSGSTPPGTGVRPIVRLIVRPIVRPIVRLIVRPIVRPIVRLIVRLIVRRPSAFPGR